MADETRIEEGQVWEARGTRDAGRRIRVITPFTPVPDGFVAVVDVKTGRRSTLKALTLRQRYWLPENPGGAS